MGRKYPSIATAVTAMVAQACGLVTANDEPPADRSPVAGSAGSGSGGSSSAGGEPHRAGAGGLQLGGTGGTLAEPTCDPKPLLEDQIVSDIGKQRVFYSWTTQEQAAELRAGGDLFSRSERPGEGRGQLFARLAEIASAPSNHPGAALAYALGNEVFAKQRYAWTNPWATLLGFPGESYGDQLLQIELEPEAWIAKLEQDGVISVVDANGDGVPLEMALANPERIGAIFHLSPGDDTEAYCGTFSQGGVGFREFALGNIAMVKRWSLATSEIEQRLQSDIETLKAFKRELECADVSSDWSSGVVCDWGHRYFPGNARSSYDFSLALPSELYRPTQENLDALIAALEASLPTGDPLVVTPEE